jgi:CRP/FNR family transcriptional regulator
LLLCRFPSRAVAGVTLLKQRRRLRRGELLFRQGDAFEALHTVCAGAIKTVVADGRTARQTTGFCLPGEVVGIAGLKARRYCATAVALEATEVSVIPFRSLAAALEVEPRLRRIVFKILAEQLAHDENLLRSLVGKKAAMARLSACLLSLAQRYEARGFSATELPLPMSRSDISNYLGLAKETVCRLLARFTKEGLISLDGHRLYIHDQGRLVRLANGNRGLPGGDFSSAR